MPSASRTARRLLEHADPHVRVVLVAALSTGCRVGEILSLQWSQIRRDAMGEARRFELPAAKLGLNFSYDRLRRLWEDALKWARLRRPIRTPAIATNR
jgi:integrase